MKKLFRELIVWDMVLGFVIGPMLLIMTTSFGGEMFHPKPEWPAFIWSILKRFFKIWGAWSLLIFGISCLVAIFRRLRNYFKL